LLFSVYVLEQLKKEFLRGFNERRAKKSSRRVNRNIGRALIQGAKMLVLFLWAPEHFGIKKQCETAKPLDVGIQLVTI
jgi:hypothetical protein